MSANGRLENARIGVKTKLAIMWVVIMFFYLYNDLFHLMHGVQTGESGWASPPSELMWLIFAMVITPSALMPLLTLVLSPAVSRWTNIILGAAYFVVIVLTILPASTSWYYRYIGIVENVVTLAVIWTAWRWPRVELAQQAS